MTDYRQTVGKSSSPPSTGSTMTTSNLRDVIDQWRSGEASVDEVRDAIDQWRSDNDQALDSELPAEWVNEPSQILSTGMDSPTENEVGGELSFEVTNTTDEPITGQPYTNLGRSVAETFGELTINSGETATLELTLSKGGIRDMAYYEEGEKTLTVGMTGSAGDIIQTDVDIVEDQNVDQGDDSQSGDSGEGETDNGQDTPDSTDENDDVEVPDDNDGDEGYTPPQMGENPVNPTTVFIGAGGVIGAALLLRILR